MAYIITFGKLAYMILQSNVDIISKNFPKKKNTLNLNWHTSSPSKSMPMFKSVKEKKIWFQVFMDLGILSYNLWRVGIFKPCLRLNFATI